MPSSRPASTSTPRHSRTRVFKDIDLFHHVQGYKNIIQLIEYSPRSCSCSSSFPFSFSCSCSSYILKFQQAAYSAVTYRIHSP